MTSPALCQENMRCVLIPYKTDGCPDIPFGSRNKTDCRVQITHHDWGGEDSYGTDIQGSILIEGLFWFDKEWISGNGIRIPGHLIPYAVDALKAVGELTPNPEGVCLKYDSFRQMNKIRFSVSGRSDRSVRIDVQRQCFESTDPRDDGFRYVSAICFPMDLVAAVVSAIERVTRLNEFDVLSWYDQNKPFAIDV